ncbi:hypothetical protein SAMN05660653_00170 [Desulfonatronum thiosulfatophilum]|uniref:Uncharacterized protein n=1 Tax=Desulfonatronum thiosulfatophilum TaxID=617002 RepID=A0A1G6A5N5_9BACT|nr:hypothetical protein [Desulfonatronum thiosulfatophilum]SDB03737.1 hypothetical protein SAMN05660653_00170 [Desulfonatronum thiosulfatophilum]
MLDNLKTQLTLAALAAKTLGVDFLDVTGEQVTETVSALISLGLVVAAGVFRYLGTQREKRLREGLEWAERHARLLERQIRKEN